MREYLRIRTVVALVLAAYFAGGLLTLLRDDMEIFPVYSWFLFALVPTGGTQYGLLIDEVNGHALQPPQLYQEAESIIPTAHSVTVYKITQAFGKAVKGKDPTLEHYRALLEKNWLPPGTKYELVEFNGDAISRWKQHRYEISNHLKTFQSGEPTK